MAKKKTEKTSPFVPVEEQPYEVPENWCWVYIKSLASFVSKGTTPKGGKTAYYDSGIPFLRVENIEDDGTISMERIKFVTEEEHNNFLKRSRLHVGDVLVSIAGTLGKTSIVTEDCVPMNINQAIAFIRLSNKNINPKFLKLAIDVPLLNNLLLSKTKVTSIPNLTLEIIQNLPVPLSPLIEQERIVGRIESLFAKLDEAKEKAQEALESFEVRQLSILNSAFSGELTSKWRIQYAQNEKWEIRTFESCISVMQNGLAKRSGNEGLKTVVLRLANLSDEGININDLREIKLTEKEFHSYGLNHGDVLMIRVNGSKDNVGRQFLYEKAERWAFCDHIIRIKYSEDILPRYMVYYSYSKVYKEYVLNHIVSSAGQNTISRKGMVELVFNIPPMSEQAEIVRILDHFFVKETEAKEKVKTTLDAIETMKRAILTKAFRGELGTNNPEDESAEELLKRTLT